MPLKGTIVPVTPFPQNCALFWDEATMRGTVIDPGGDAPKIMDAIGETGMTPTGILLTHGHLDHAGGADELRGLWEAKSGARLPIVGPGEEDRAILQDIEAKALTYGLRGMRNVLPDRWLKERDTVEIGGEPFAVLHCPGHTPGHMVFVSEDLRFAVVGDVLFQGSVGRTDFSYGDHEALVDSIRAKLFPLGDDIAFVCGHGPGSTFGEERKGNPFVGDGV